MNKLVIWILLLVGSVVALWLIAEITTRLYLEMPLQTSFYGSIPRRLIAERQAYYGVQVANGPGWVHLGWIADPEKESYRVAKLVDGIAKQVGQAHYGSFLMHGESGTFQVWAVPWDTQRPRLVGEAQASPDALESPVSMPRITGTWKVIFKPEIFGDYVNDHTVYQDTDGNWRLVGITSKSDGDFNAERYFIMGVSPDFPPEDGMSEAEPVADFGELAWAPHVTKHEKRYHMLWSPHKLHQMTSDDGVSWESHDVTMITPIHKFFRDPMVVQVAPNQWLLYTTARGAYYSQIDVYQSFDLQEWQYIRTALRSGWGSERNSPFSSMESPFVTEYQGHYYLSLTYNNDSFFWPGILMLFKIWPDPTSYNETLIFHADNPYDFGAYHGKQNAPTLLTQLETHAPEIIYHPGEDTWYITTAGWPWVSTLTSGEVAVAPLTWELLR